MNNVPDGWKIGKLQDFIFLQRGFDLTKSQTSEGNVPVISSSGISYYHDTAMVEPPGVITGRKGSLGAVYFVDVPYWPHDTTLWVKDFKGNHPEYVKIFLENLNLERFDAATSVPTLNRNNVHALRVAFPPFPEQQKIAEILFTWDEAISKTEQLIVALQRRKKGLMQRLLNGEVRFPGFVLSKKVKETKYGKVLSDWKSFHLEDVTFESRARAASENAVDLTVFGVNNQTGLTKDSKYSADNLDRYKVVKPGMFAYNPMRLNIGSIGCCDELLGEGLVSPDYVVFGCKEDKLDSKYFSYCIQEHHWKNWVRRAGAGSVRVRIYYKDISKYPVVLPTLFEQRKIAEVLQACDSEINLNTKKLEALRQQKKGLMQRLLTGQVRVKV